MQRENVRADCDPVTDFEQESTYCNRAIEPFAALQLRVSLSVSSP